MVKEGVDELFILFESGHRFDPKIAAASMSQVDLQNLMLASRKVKDSWELLVDGKPYLILGAELQKSSMSLE